MQVLILRPYRKDNIYFRTIEEREKINVFLFRRLRALVTMATYSSHRLIMGKVKIDNSAVSLEIFDFSFTDMFTD